MRKKVLFMTLLLVGFMAGAVTCRHCGETVGDKDVYCFSCGKNVLEKSHRDDSFDVRGAESKLITPLKLSLFDVCGFPASKKCCIVGADLSVIDSCFDSLYGVSLSGMSSVARRMMCGFQTGGLMSEAGEVYGCQIAGVCSKAKEAYGLQIGGLGSDATKKLRGIQIGFVNAAPKDTRGLQIGFLNKIGEQSFLLLNFKF